MEERRPIASDDHRPYQAANRDGERRHLDQRPRDRGSTPVDTRGGNGDAGWNSVVASHRQQAFRRRNGPVAVGQQGSRQIPGRRRENANAHCYGSSRGASGPGRLDRWTASCQGRGVHAGWRKARGSGACAPRLGRPHLFWHPRGQRRSPRASEAHRRTARCLRPGGRPRRPQETPGAHRQADGRVGHALGGWCDAARDRRSRGTGRADGRRVAGRCCRGRIARRRGVVARLPSGVAAPARSERRCG